MGMENDALIELADIVSNGNDQVVSDITLLVRDPATFVEAHNRWYESTFAGSVDDDNADIVDVFTSWLVESHIGAYIDRNAKPAAILSKLSGIEATLGLSLHLTELTFTGDEETTELLDLVGTDLESEGCGLYRLDVDADGFLLFIVRDEVEDRFMSDVANLGFEGHMH